MASLPADNHDTSITANPPILTIHVSKAGKTFTAKLPQEATLSDLISACEESTTWTTTTTATLSSPSDNSSSSSSLPPPPPPPHFDWDKAKFIAKGTILKSGPDDNTPIAHLSNKTVMLQVPTVQDIQGLREASEAAQARQARRQAQRRLAVPARQTATRRGQMGGFGAGDSTYTFLRIEPLPGLRNPERSRALLQRLAEDPGIMAAMKKHQFTVGLLTEMDPLTNTQSTHEGTTRLLGLNRNHGEVIELRLRTDAYDGYRAYATIRATLCHELAHNVHGPHDRKFWDLCHQIEREVQAADWKSGGQSVDGGGAGFHYEPSEEEEAPDHGGWTGGTYVLGGGNAGGGGSSSSSSSSSASANTAGGLSRRDVIARAAEERMRRMREESGNTSSNSSNKLPDQENNDQGGSRTDG